MRRRQRDSQEVGNASKGVGVGVGQKKKDMLKLEARNTDCLRSEVPLMLTASYCAV